MESPSSPCPPPRPPNALLPRRSVTLPIHQKLSVTRERRVSSSGPPDPRVETLYSHPSARIVAFTASTPSLGKSTSVEVEAGTLPWTSKLERTIAIGQMRIYRPPGSVAFLSCGSVIKPILPKSQCWCVDEEASNFVLLIRRPQYWRIELSMKASNAEVESEKFKDVLSTILFFEKTPCPFARGFTVDLPEQPKGPVIKKPWKPVEKPKLEMVSVVELLPSMEVESADEYYSAPSENSSLYGGDESDATDDTNATTKYSNSPQELPHDETSDVPSNSLISRHPKTAHRLSLRTPNPSNQTSRPKSPLGKSSSSSSTESFHTTQSWHSPLTPFPPSPPLSNPTSPLALCSNNDLKVPKRQDQNHNSTNPTTSPSTPGCWASPYAAEPTSLISPIPQTPSLVYPSDDDTKSVSTNSEISTPPRLTRSKSPSPSPSLDSKIQHRATTSSNSRRRTLSPLPSPAAMFSPDRRRQKQLQLNYSSSPNRKFQARQLPGIMMRKTCEILLSPPGHLINLMLSIAAKISAGEWKDGWMIWGGGDGGVAFEVEGEGEEGEVDDFGYEIKRKTSSTSSSNDKKERVRMEMPGSWEVD